MKVSLKEHGIQNDDFELLKISDLIDRNIIDKPLDGNHGELHPKENDYVKEGIPFVMASDINDGKINFQSCKYITKKQSDSLRKGFSIKGDVLLTHKASIGRTALVGAMPYPYIMLTPQVTYYRVNNKSKLNKFYLKHYFDSSFFQQIIKLWAGSGSTRDYLGINEQQKLPVILPPLSIQEKIAAILSTYDDMIENNNRRIAIFEKMAEELYREWFVRLRFPGHEKVKIVKGVPDGWEVKRLGDIASFTMGQSPESEFYNEVGDGPPFNQGVGTYGRRFPKRTTYCSSDGRRAHKGDILFSVRAPVGRLNIADCEMIIGRGLAAIKHKENFNSYLFYLLKTAFSIEDIIGNGTIFNSVGKDELAKFAIYQPFKELIKQFDAIVSKIDMEIAIIDQSLERLSTTRNSLLSRLMSGKIDVENMDIEFPASMKEELVHA